MIKFAVNGKAVSVDAETDTPLLWALREDLQLTGTKFGCGMAPCGACAVHVDGQAVRSCSTPLSAAVGRGRPQGDDDRRRGRQQDLPGRAGRMVAHDVPQSGNCQSGQIMSACALLAKNKRPTDADIDGAMAGNICRCGTCNHIRAAIQDAAIALRKG